LYRLTFKGENGNQTFQVELSLQKITELFHRQGDLSKLVKIERINRVTGKVVGGIYDK
jgi:hypothetical protein